MNTAHDNPEQQEGPATAHETTASATGQDPTPGAPSPGNPYGGQAGQPSARFFQWLRSLGIQRGRNRWVGGVCSGLADKWGIDPVIVRGLAVVLTLFFGIGLLAYGVAWALLPEPDGRIHVEEVARGRWSAGMTGAGIATLLGLGGSGQGIFTDGDGGWFFWPIVWIGGIAWLIYWAANRDKPKNIRKAPEGPAPHGQPGQPWYGTTWQGPGQPGTPAGQPNVWQGPSLPAPPQHFAPAPAFAPDPKQYVKAKTVKTRPRLGAAASFLVIGAAAVVGAAVLLLDAGNVIHLGGYEAGVAAAAAAITAGLGIVAAGISGRTAGGLGTFAIVALLFAGLMSLPPSDFSGFNQSTWAPTTVTAAENGRTVVMGNATIDLTRLSTPLADDVQIPLDLVAASVTIRVPGDVPVQLKSELAAANLTIDGEDTGGTLAENTTRDINPKATGKGIVITLQGAATNIDVVVVP